MITVYLSKTQDQSCKFHRIYSQTPWLSEDYKDGDEGTVSPDPDGNGTMGYL